AGCARTCRRWQPDGKKPTTASTLIGATCRTRCRIHLERRASALALDHVIPHCAVNPPPPHCWLQHSSGMLHGVPSGLQPPPALPPLPVLPELPPAPDAPPPPDAPLPPPDPPPLPPVAPPPSVAPPLPDDPPDAPAWPPLPPESSSSLPQARAGSEPSTTNAIATADFLAVAAPCILGDYQSWSRS